MLRPPLVGILVLLVVGLVSSCAHSTIQGGPVAEDELVDGLYRGSARNGPVIAVVDVVVADQGIAEIRIVRHGHWRGGAAEEAIPGWIIEQQSTRVDVVTGATISSVALMNAVDAALQKAMN